ncbi:MAG: pilin [Gammaproteobacteria bacterium]|nr:pilin [Gammaproteobacteria bacterium]
MDAQTTVDTHALVYAKERSLFALSVLIGSIAWIALVVGTLGIALVYALFGLLAFLLAHSALISHLRGSGVRITAEQFPDLHARLLHCCRTLGIDTPPEAYLLQAGGSFNAFATRFLGRNFVVLFSDVVDALEDDPDAINFYFGHELGHLHRKHLQWAPLLWPAGMLPLLGAAYSRSREYTCDGYGAACCGSPQSVAHGIAALAAGHRRWRVLNVDAFQRQALDSGGFWMSFNELIADYPWLSKRMARRLTHDYRPPSRHGLAWMLAAVVPRLGGGGAGGMLVTLFAVGILAAVAVPAYQDYTVRARVTEGLRQADSVKTAVAQHYAEHQSACASNDECALPAPETLGNDVVESIAVGDDASVTVTYGLPAIASRTVVFEPSLDASGTLTWRCTGGTLEAKYRPSACRE